MQLYPAIELELNDRKVDLVAEGIDVAIRGAVGLADSSLISRPLLSSPTLTLASPQYLAKAGRPAHPSELSRHKTLCYSYLKDPNLWAFISPEGEDIQVRVTPKVLTNSPQMELAMCVASEGIMRMPAFNLTDELAGGKLETLLDEFHSPEVKLYLVYPGRKHLASRVRCFIDFMAERMPQSMAAPCTEA
ncbi:MAG: substrate binding domain-containing protein [Shewanella sp.]|nr:substrate binding domain-containing protein [Shewanella sp.]MCF1431944.1 substrate binding domain-containing protein [Shewanella sp.]